MPNSFWIYHGFKVRKLIQKVCKREIFRYRKLTDKPVDTERVQKSDSKSNLEELAAGNKKYIPTFRSLSNESLEDITGNNSESVSKSSLITYNGALVDVAKLLEQLERSEKARLEADEKLKGLEEELESLNEINSAKEKQSTKLSQTLDEQSKKLRSTEEDLKKTKLEADRYYKTLINIKDDIMRLQSNSSSESSSQKSKSRSARNSPLNRRDSDSDCSSQSNKNKTDKESNGLDNGKCDTSDNLQVKVEKEEAMEAD